MSTALHKLISANGPKRNKENVRFFNRVDKCDFHSVSGSGTFPENPMRGLLNVPALKKKPKNARHLVALLLLGSGYLQEPELRVAQMSSGVYLSSMASQTITSINENGSLQLGNTQAAQGRLRSFDDLVAMVNTYFPKVHHLKIYEYYRNTVFTKLTPQYGNNGSKYFFQAFLFPNFASCSTMSRIRCTFNSESRDIYNNSEDRKFYQSNDVLNIKEYNQLIAKGIRESVEFIKSRLDYRFDCRSTNIFSSIMSWQQLENAYYVKYGVKCSSLTPVVLSHKDFSYYYKN